MNNRDIAQAFDNIAGLLNIQGEKWYIVASYERAALSIEDHSSELADMVRNDDDLTAIDGIGDAIATKTRQLVMEGKINIYERLRGEFPEGLLDVMQIPGVGPKTARTAWELTGATTPGEFEAALKSGRLYGIPQIAGQKGQAVLEHLESNRARAT